MTLRMTGREYRVKYGHAHQVLGKKNSRKVEGFICFKYSETDANTNTNRSISVEPDMGLLYILNRACMLPVGFIYV